MKRVHIADADPYGCFYFALSMAVMSWGGGCEVRVTIESSPADALEAPPAPKPPAEEDQPGAR